MRAHRELTGAIMALAFCGLPRFGEAQRPVPSAPDLQVEIGPSGSTGIPNQFTVINAGTSAAPATLLQVRFDYPVCGADWECMSFQWKCPALPHPFEEVIQSLPAGGRQVVFRTLPQPAVTAISVHAPNSQYHEGTYVQWGQSYLVCAIWTTATADAQGHVQEANEGNNKVSRLGERKLKLLE